MHHDRWPRLEFQFSFSGFGFDRESDEYKLVQIIFEKPDRRYAYDCRDYTYDISRVYSVKTNSWRLVKSKLWNDFEPCISDPPSRTSGTCFKDSLYRVSGDLKFMMSFILSNDLFETISLPSNQILEQGKPLPYLTRIGSLEKSFALFRRRTQLPLTHGIHSLTTTSLCRLGLWDFEEKKFGELRINVNGREEDRQQVLDVHPFERAHNPVKLRKLMDY
ncbi:hypothetical protein FNV43_RR20724 [Rhamnella rubrinervis]|uniref:Uncharacterized protein n=1 Tax=Rhamnella rubrinervis TaxID=2594499 RepID=A0A8K0GUU0_9ROSA|nr:hypothetical protein FNV43_RR20724 [Rhamnella rubrinervis]